MTAATFHGVELWAPEQAKRTGARVAIFGAGYDSGGTNGTGSALAPSAVRSASLLSGPLSHVLFGQMFLDDKSVVDAGDVPLTGDPFSDLTAISSFARSVHQFSRTSITIGGNHSVSVPLVTALAATEGPLNLIVLDAHLDTWIEEGGGAPGHGSALYRCIESGAVASGAVIGWRGYGPNSTHRDWVEARNVAVWTMEDVEHLGLSGLVELVAERAAGRSYLSIDIDVVDPSVAPGTSTREPGGLTSRELLAVVRSIAASTDLVGADIVEVYPNHDVNGITSELAHRCVLELLAGIRFRDEATSMA